MPKRVPDVFRTLQCILTAFCSLENSTTPIAGQLFISAARNDSFSSFCCAFEVRIDLDLKIWLIDSAPSERKDGIAVTREEMVVPVETTFLVAQGCLFLLVTILFGADHDGCM